MGSSAKGIVMVKLSKKNKRNWHNKTAVLILCRITFIEYDLTQPKKSMVIFFYWLNLGEKSFGIYYTAIIIYKKYAKDANHFYTV